MPSLYGSLCFTSNAPLQPLQSPPTGLSSAPQEPDCLAGLPQHGGHSTQCPATRCLKQRELPRVKKIAASILLVGLGMSVPKVPCPTPLPKSLLGLQELRASGLLWGAFTCANLAGTKPGGILSLDPSWKEGWVFPQPPQHQSTD